MGWRGRGWGVGWEGADGVGAAVGEGEREIAGGAAVIEEGEDIGVVCGGHVGQEVCRNC